MAKTAERPAPTAIVKHSLVVAGHRTSISLEDAFWQALKATAAGRDLSIAALVAEIDATRGPANLSSAIRVHLFLSGAEPNPSPACGPDEVGSDEGSRRSGNSDGGGGDAPHPTPRREATFSRKREKG